MTAESNESWGYDERWSQRRGGRAGPCRARPQRASAAAPSVHLERILRQLIDPMILLLIGACAVTVLLDDVSDSIIIGVVVVLNTAIGVAQELRAEKALQALHAMSAPVCRVVRAGVRTFCRRPSGAGRRDPAERRRCGASRRRAARSACPGGQRGCHDRRVVSDRPRRRRHRPFRNGGHPWSRSRSREPDRQREWSGADRGGGRVCTDESTPLQRRLTRLSRDLVIATTAVCVLVLVSGFCEGGPWRRWCWSRSAWGSPQCPSRCPRS